MSHNEGEDQQLHINRRLVLIIGAFVLAGCGLIVLTNMAIGMLSAARSYTAVQSTWSQAQQQTVSNLERYAETRDEEYYSRYAESIRTVKNLQTGLNELFKEDMRARKVFEAFNRADIPYYETSSMIMNYPRFEYFPDFKEVIDQWERIDQKVTKLWRMGDELHQQIKQDEGSTASLNSKMKEIYQINRTLQQSKRILLLKLAETTHTIKQLALWCIVFLGIILVLVGILVGVRTFKSIEKWNMILKQQDYLASFPETNPNPIIHLDLDGNIIYQNPAAHEEFPRLDEQELDHPFMERIPEVIDSLASAESHTFSLEVKVGEVVYQQSIYYIPSMESFYVYSVDITEQKEKEEQVRRSLKEKEVLLTEIHHRVKNNLAVVSGLLEMQMLNIADGKAKEALRDSQTRIHSMATVHEILYKAEQFANVDMNEYIRELAEYICDTFSIGERNIDVDLRIEDIQLNINQAIPCGLILNELLSNSIEHAFENEEAGQIQIQFVQENQHVTLRVMDDGHGLPEEFKINEANTLGMTIIRELVKQLNAEIYISQNGKTSFSVLFEKSEDPGSSNVSL